MTLGEILNKCSSLPVEEERSANEQYKELVIYSKDLKQWCDAIASLLGPPAKAEGDTPSKRDLDLTQPYGGIYENQILFKKEDDNSMVLAMFWPWQNGLNTTLKLVLLEKK